MIKLADVDGKCALVTNGTTGVGLAFAKELLREKAAVFLKKYSTLTAKYFTTKCTIYFPENHNHR